MRIIIAVAVAALVGATAVRADSITFDGFLRSARRDEALRMWVWTTGQGFMMAQMIYKKNGYPYLYCQPGKLALTPEQYIEILTAYVSKDDRGRREFDNSVASAWLFNALEQTFPCDD